MAKIPPPGRLVDVGGRSLHVDERGSGTPLVLFEAGIAASSVSWRPVQDLVAAATETAAYDRAGFGWSDAASRLKTADDAANDLLRLLVRGRMRTPVVLVGHSFGGLVARIFQQRYPGLVVGLVLVDPVVRCEWRNASEPRLRMLDRGAKLSRRGATLARLGIVGAALRTLVSGSSRVPKLLANVSAGAGAHVAHRLVGEVRKLPRELWPVVAQHWSQSRSFEAMATNLENLPTSVTQLDETRGLGDMPVSILSASRLVPEHEADAALSTRGQHLVVPGAGHWLQLDAPATVAAAVLRVVEAVRQSPLAAS
jgi:pimeloyl-ACP methyl ester carboxylesterase